MPLGLLVDLFFVETTTPSEFQVEVDSVFVAVVLEITQEIPEVVLF